ncbi:hypothetical protein SRRS_09080 [Sporomusa rhizae]
MITGIAITLSACVIFLVLVIKVEAYLENKHRCL